MTEQSNSHPQARITANVNLKVTEEERWSFKEWCARNRMSQVDAFRRAFALLREEFASKGGRK